VPDRVEWTIAVADDFVMTEVMVGCEPNPHDRPPFSKNLCFFCLFGTCLERKIKALSASENLRHEDHKIACLYSHR